MSDNSQNWMLFGYDVRRTFRLWSSAWREMLWGVDSPVRSRLDDVVRVQGEDFAACYQAGEPCGDSATPFNAVLLPDDLVLVRQLRLPAAVETELDAVLALEVNANSPFTREDTASGWRITSRSEIEIRVQLVVVSRIAVMTYLGSRYGEHDRGAREVWARVDDSMVVIHGFGESRREARYRKRMWHSAGMLALVFIVLLLASLAAAGIKAVEFGRVQALASIAQREAATAVQSRDSLSRASSVVQAVNTVAARYPNPHMEIARLTELLGDETHIKQFSMRGRDLRLRGQSADAAAVMELLTEEPRYEDVTAPQAITRLGNSGQEQFYLNVRIAEGRDQ